MSESIGPRTYLVGQVLSVVLARHPINESKTVDENVEAAVAFALKVVDATLDKMQWPDGTPRRD